MIAQAERLQQEHAQLLEHVEHIRLAAREIPELSPEERSAVVERILDFLRGTLEPHAQEEERTMYPTVARALGDPQSTATMVRDHEAIRRWIAELTHAGADEPEQLQELLYGLFALISVHFWKEETEYLPLLEQEGPVLVHEP